MILKFLSPLLFCFFQFHFVNAQGIRGKITNEQGEPVPYANIYVPLLSTGTTSNIDGNYELKLPEGIWKVLVQYLGYHTQTLELPIDQNFKEIPIRLIAQDYRISEIKVLASGEDPAYYIMRRAISMAPYYQKQVSKYSCKVYLKGSGAYLKIPKIFRKDAKKDGVIENEPFVMETVSKIDFELPDKLTQQVVAMRSSGKQNNTSPMPMITYTLYDTDKYGVVSPVGRNALKVYHFKLESVFEDQGRTINKIIVTPKIKGKDVFSGTIYIADGFWNIHSADLKMVMAMADVNFHHVYAEVNKNTWMPVSIDFDLNVSVLGIKMQYKYVASINEYKTVLNPALDHSFIEKQQNEIILEEQLLGQKVQENKPVQEKQEAKQRQQKQITALMEKPELSNRETVKLNRLIEAEAQRTSPPEPLEIKSGLKVSQRQVNNDTAYWEKLRPIPLTEKEKTSFASKDSFLRVSSTPEYKDSIRDSRRKFKVEHLLSGKQYNYSVDSIQYTEYFKIPGLLEPTSLSFNSVDGLRFGMDFSYLKNDSAGKALQLRPQLAYAFAREKLDASFLVRKQLNGMTKSNVEASLGTTTPDFNRFSGMGTLTNDTYTLWLEQNNKRFYRRDFFNLAYSRDLANGLNMNVSVDYSNNFQLTNHSNFSLIDYENREIQPNIPQNAQIEPWQLDDHQSFTGQILLEYTPRMRYRIRNHTKFYAYSKYPTFTLVYRGAYPEVFWSDSRYDFLKLGMRQQVNFGIDEHLNYTVNAGAFLNKGKMYFEEFQHFNTQPTEYQYSSSANSFRLLPFYEYSTSSRFAEAYVTWDSRRLILKQLPFIKSTALSESIFVNFLTTPQLKNYTEVGYGINKIFLLMNIEAVVGFENGKYHSAGIKFSLNLDGFN